MIELPINEIFQTIQGEATWTGTPAVFIRLQGCPVGCPWCDTKHTWEVDLDKQITVEALMAKTADAPTFCNLNPHDLLVLIMKNFQARHIVITGGEPAMYDLRRLTRMLHEQGYTTQIETSGTYMVLCEPETFVTVSPKIGMPGGRHLDTRALDRADEIKMPVGKGLDVARVGLLAERWKDKAKKPTIWLQPLSQSEKATELCIEKATAHGWKISIQTHKFLGVR